MTSPRALAEETIRLAKSVTKDPASLSDWATRADFFYHAYAAAPVVARAYIRLFDAVKALMDEENASSEDAVRVRAALSAAQQRTDTAESLLAGLADCINQELRENGSVDVSQVEKYLGDMRPFVRRLVDLVRERSDRAAQQREERLREALRLVVSAELERNGLYGEVARPLLEKVYGALGGPPEGVEG